MKIPSALRLAAIAVFVGLFMIGDLHGEDQRNRHPHYKLVDLGTLGGPISYGSANGDGGRLLNNMGVVSSYADTTTPDPLAPDFCFDPDCLVAHAYRWRHGHMRDLGRNLRQWRCSDGHIDDLGALAPGGCSMAESVNSRRQVVGQNWTDCVFQTASLTAVISERGGPLVDLNTLIPPISGVLLRDATNINDRGEIVMYATFPNGNKTLAC